MLNININYCQSTLSNERAEMRRAFCLRKWEMSVFRLEAKVITEKSRGGRSFWNRNWDLGWIWAGFMGKFIFFQNIVDDENIFGIE